MRFISFLTRSTKYFKFEQFKQYVPSFWTQKNYYSTWSPRKEELIDPENIQDIKDVFNHPLRIEAAKKLAEGDKSGAAKKYDEWFKQNGVLDKMKCFGSSSPSVRKQINENEYLKEINDIHLPNVINGFLGCSSENRDDGCKKHLKKIANSGYLKNGRDYLDNSLLHMVARYKNKNNAELFESLLKDVKETTSLGTFLSTKNWMDDSPVEIAFSTNNKMFFELMNKTFGKGFYKTDPMIVRNLDLLTTLGDDWDQELLSVSGLSQQYEE